MHDSLILLGSRARDDHLQGCYVNMEMVMYVLCMQPGQMLFFYAAWRNEVVLIV
jgi:hypothetical protein